MNQYLLNINTWQTLNRKNAYFEFLEKCKTKVYPPDTPMHFHHIIPKYVFKNNLSPENEKFLNSSENLILLSVNDHVEAHKLLYDIYGNNQDKGAGSLLKGYKKESVQIWRQLGAEATHKLLEERGQNFWNSDFQKEMARRSLAKEDALATRSAGGKKGGAASGIKRSSIRPEDKYLFSYEKDPILCIFNCNVGTQVLEELKKYKVTELQRVSILLNGTKKSLHGWSCVRLNDDGSPRNPDVSDVSNVSNVSDVKAIITYQISKNLKKSKLISKKTISSEAKDGL